MLRNPNGLAYAVMVLLGVDVFFDLLLAGDEVWTLADPEAAYETTTIAGLDPVMAALASGVAYLATVVVFLVWFHRVRKNADVWAPDIHRRTPGWAIGAWFIPFANLWIPRQIAVDVWRASRPDPYAADGARELTLLNSWWTCFAVGAVVDRISNTLYKRAETLDAWTTAAAWSLAGYLFTIAAGVLAILFVRRLTSMQHTRATGMLSAAK
ncbi:DUF4328 domain-containing protein [Streptomyces sp. R302]|uniref:DUF4328 domain-containing protein n=1 Tax=unclassified Streptomyces TaxID=2593676 RepID=UPI00145E4A5C|nr:MULTISPECIES: DUF4328 domain-containing protein [unclassified Streptomyces]NML50515.1 DUF4328 domain-containing protein [Streptomyces sp. R301]NML79506.1 DUF4328 domain-containing protein [Streptomyces sp. R302]